MSEQLITRTNLPAEIKFNYHNLYEIKDVRDYRQYVEIKVWSIEYKKYREDKWVYRLVDNKKGGKMKIYHMEECGEWY